MKTLQIFSSLILIGLLTSCSYKTVKSDYDDEVDLWDYQTYAWAEQSQNPNGNIFASNTLVEKRIKRAVETELDAQGFSKNDNGNPDFLIAYHVEVAKKVNVFNSSPYYYGAGYRYYPRYYGFGYRSRHFGYGRYGYSGYGYDGSHAYDYNEGTIVIDFLDPITKELVWRGWYTGEIKERSIAEKEIHKAVKHVLEKFPPKNNT